MKKVIPLVTVLLVLGFGVLGQAQGHLLLRIDHEETALEVGYTGPGGSYESDFYVALFSKRLEKFATEHWWLDEKQRVSDLRNLRDSLKQYLAAPNKGLSCIYPSDFYDPGQEFQVLGLGNTILIRGIDHEDSGDVFVEIKLSLNEAQRVVAALTTALNSVND